MKTFGSDKIKNIALLGNASSGKTIIAETMLFEGGMIDRRGTIEGNNTISDYNEIEHENGNSVFPSVLHTIYNDTKINIIDPPGADDFCGGAVIALNAADTGLMVINAQNGVEVGAEIHSRFASGVNKPLIFAVNQLDHDKANFEKSIESCKERFGSGIIVAQYPLETGSNFNSIVDVIKMKLYKYPTEGGKPDIQDIPDNEKSRAEAYQSELIEKAAESDESLMETFFENGTLTEEEIQQGIKNGLLQRGMFPVFCISAKKNIGIGRLLEFIANAAPLPSDMPGYKTTEGEEMNFDSSGKPSLFVFKSSIETHIGEITYFKVVKGEITESIDLVNANNQTKERLSQLYVCNGKNRTKVSKFTAGDIGATVKLKNTKANHTLNGSGLSHTYEPIRFPEPKFRTAIKPVSEGDDEKLGEALQRMHHEDPTILIEYSKELKQIILSGQGEYHLNILKWHLDNIFKIETAFIAPKIPYRETITKVAQSDYRHKKQSGGAGQFGEEIGRAHV